MDPQPSAPPVVAVVVTCDPGRWLETCLEGLAGQDYPNLSVLVIDAASGRDPTPRVAAIMPSAYVRRIGERPGFAAAANEVLGVVEGASHFLFCHDDVALAPDALRQLVEEAFRSNAGLVSPKLVEWEAPDRLLAVGAGADKGGSLVALVERGELDQEQHDAVRDVFVAPAGCMLVRADLFATLGGFDPEMNSTGEELDLCWRAQIAGARVVVAPSAVVRHLEATATGQRDLEGNLTSPLDRPAAPDPGEALEVVSLETAEIDLIAEDAPTASPAEAGSRRRRPVVRVRALTRSRVRVVLPRTPVEVETQLELADRRDTARLRAVLKNYGRLHLLRVLPQLVAVSVLEIVVALSAGRRRAAGAVVRSWRVNLADWRGIGQARKQVRAARAVPDHEVRQLQTRGNARLRAVLRSGGRGTNELRLPGSADLAASWHDGLRLTFVVWAVVAAVALFGSRHLLGSHLPTFGELEPLAAPSTLWHHAVSGWRTTGLGSPTPAPTAFAILAFAGGLFLGHVGLLQRLLVFATIPIGAWGMLRFARPLGSRRVRLVAGVLYIANPLVYDAFARGHWSGMVVYAVLPWVLLALAGATRLAPFATGDASPVSFRSRAVSLGLVLALTGAFVPALLPMTVAVGVVLVAGSILAGEVGRAIKAVWLALSGFAIAAVLLFPWAIGLLPPGGEWAALTRPAPGTANAIPLAQLLRFQTGPNGASPLGWALLVAAALPLIVGHGWRFAWATRLWTLAAAAWALAWVATRGWVTFPLPPPEVLLAPAAVALAACAGLGMAAFEIDLRGYHFGWRQLVSTVAASAAALSVLPALGSAGDGRWHGPAQGFDQVLSWMPDKRAEGDFRVLWLGDGSVLPIAGWPLASGLAYATTRNGLPDITTNWPGASRGATRLLGQAVVLAQRDNTTQLGHLLAPLAVRFLVVVDRAAPSHQPGIIQPPPASLLSGLASQIDLRRIDSDPSIVVYENAAWAPMRAVLPPDAATPSQSDDPAAARNVELAGAQPVLQEELSPTSFRGPVTAPATLLLSEASSSRWHLTVNGAGAPREAAFGSVNTFIVTASGQATVAYRTPLVRGLAIVLQLVLWILALAWLWRARRRRRSLPSRDGTLIDSLDDLVHEILEVTA